MLTLNRLSGGCSSALLSGDSCWGLLQEGCWGLLLFCCCCPGCCFLRGVTSRLRPRPSIPPSVSRNSYSSITLSLSLSHSLSLSDHSITLSVVPTGRRHTEVLLARRPGGDWRCRAAPPCGRFQQGRHYTISQPNRHKHHWAGVDC